MATSSMAVVMVTVAVGPVPVMTPTMVMTTVALMARLFGAVSAVTAAAAGFSGGGDQQAGGQNKCADGGGEEAFDHGWE